MASTDSPTPETERPIYRYRLRYEKTGELAWIGHQDLMRLLDRLMRRGAIPVALSEGFSPRPRINLVQALGLGIAAHREVLEMELFEPLPPQTLLDRLNSRVPPGLRFLSAVVLPGRRAARASLVSYLFATDIPEDDREAVGLRMEELLSAATFVIERKRDRKVAPLDLRPLIHSLDWSEDGHVRMILRVTPQATARPEEVLAALGLEHLYATGSMIRLDLILEETSSSSAPSPAPHEALPTLAD